MKNARPDIYISVIIPAHNEEKYIDQCLKSITSQNYPKNLYEIILVNNNSTDKTKTIAQTYNIRIIDEPDGPVGRVRNTGAKNSKGDIIMFLDGDCIAPKNWLQTAKTLLDGNKTLVIGGAYTLRPNPLFIEKYWILATNEDHVSQTDLLGGTIAIRRTTFERVGGFCENVTSGEDTKLTHDLLKSGFKVVIKNEMSVIHLGNPTTFRSFIKRQAWHSENYLQDIKSSLKDPTFYIILTLVILVVSTILTVAINYQASKYPIFTTLLIPFLFSAKRIRRSKNPKNALYLPMIYIMDLAYCLGRIIGITRSARKIFKKV